MTPKNDFSILLLQILAHDLLAPLTAIKWQAELLEKEKKTGKIEEYRKGIRESTELGISLAKHAHVAAKVLSHTYAEGPLEETSLAGVVRTTADELALQYGRHALTLEAHIEDEAGTGKLDRELVALLIWSMGKYFLTCAPPNTLVLMRGKKNDGYSLKISAVIPDMEKYIAQFSEQRGQDDFDQAHIFTTLIKEAAEKARVSVVQESQGEELVLIATFDV